MRTTAGRHWRIGVDEAGYGPNLGPLAIGATAWRVDGATDDPLYGRMANAVSAEATGDGRLHVADSKAVYKPGGGLAGLERAVLAAVAAGGEAATDWRSLLASLGADPGGDHDRQPWRATHDPSLPVDADQAGIAGAAARVAETAERAGVDPPRCFARLVFPTEFNALCQRHGTKGAALSHATLGLVRRVLGAIGALDGGEPVRVTLDKHGGRNRYAGLVQHWLPEAPIAVLEESRPASRYRVGDRIELTFRSKGEAELPVALASMIAKLLREVSMRGFNAWWAEREPGLRPTAGYPVDAKRFKRDIAETQQRLGVPDADLWRDR